MATMQKVGYRRHVAATVPEYNLVPYALAGSDLVFTTGRRFAEHQARIVPLVIVPAPREFDDMQFYQLWHQRKHASASSKSAFQGSADISSTVSTMPRPNSRFQMMHVFYAFFGINILYTEQLFRFGNSRIGKSGRS